MKHISGPVLEYDFPTIDNFIFDSQYPANRNYYLECKHYNYKAYWLWCIWWYAKTKYITFWKLINNISTKQWTVISVILLLITLLAILLKK